MIFIALDEIKNEFSPLKAENLLGNCHVNKLTYFPAY